MIREIKSSSETTEKDIKEIINKIDNCSFKTSKEYVDQLGKITHLFEIDDKTKKPFKKQIF